MPIASDFAIVFGRTGTSTSVSFRIIVTIGPQPAACAACIFVVTGPAMSPRVLNSLIPFQIFVMSDPPAHGTMMCSGARQPSCSMISNP